MHIDPDALVLKTEGDVEQKIILPLLQEDAYLGIDQSHIFSKSYLAPTTLDKVAGRTSGYYPDWSLWFFGLPIMIVEAKGPDVSAEVGYREASLYARHLNQGQPQEIGSNRHRRILLLPPCCK